jgi:hypothetical protein
MQNRGAQRRANASTLTMTRRPSPIGARNFVWMRGPNV